MGPLEKKTHSLIIYRRQMPLYNNIKDREIPALLKASYEESDGNIEKAADTLDSLDIMIKKN